MLNSLNREDIERRERGARGGAAVLDQFLARRANALRKHVGAIERVNEQCDPLNSLDLQHVRLPFSLFSLFNEFFKIKYLILY